MATDYRSTVFLPQTDFPMRADLPKREPQLLARWEADRSLAPSARQRSQGRDEIRPA